MPTSRTTSRAQWITGRASPPRALLIKRAMRDPYQPVTQLHPPWVLTHAGAPGQGLTTVCMRMISAAPMFFGGVCMVSKCAPLGPYATLSTFGGIAGTFPEGSGVFLADALSACFAESMIVVMYRRRAQGCGGLILLCVAISGFVSVVNGIASAPAPQAAPLGAWIGGGVVVFVVLGVLAVLARPSNRR